MRWNVLYWITIDNLRQTLNLILKIIDLKPSTLQVQSDRSNHGLLPLTSAVIFTDRSLPPRIQVKPPHAKLNSYLIAKHKFHLTNASCIGL